jgi:multisubunit Na+/H+ antiporter MnhB subunit
MMGRASTDTKRGLRRRLVALVLMVGVAVLLLTGTALADDSTNATLSFSLEPSNPSAHPSGYFVIAGSPGQVVEENAAVRNLTQETITVYLAAVDGASGLYGGVTYGLPTDTAKNVGAWISLSQTKITLEPAASVEVPFTVNIPENAPSGVNVGAITAWIPAVAENSTSTTGEGFGAQIIMQTRRVIAVQVTLPGDSEPVLQVSGVTPVARAAGMNLDLTIANTGHGLASGTGSIDVPSADFHKEFALGDVLPGTSIAYPIEWTTDPAENTYDVTVNIAYNGKTVDWSGSFTIGETAVSELQNYQTSTTADGQKASSGFGTSTIIIVVAGVAWLIIVGAGAYLALRAARRRRASRDQTPGPGRDPFEGPRGL